MFAIRHRKRCRDRPILVFAVPLRQGFVGQANLMFPTDFSATAHPPSPIIVKFVLQLRTMLRRDRVGVV